MAKVDIRCPVCGKWNNIEIADDATKNIAKGVLAINISPGMICEHSFIAYLDKNLIVRDSFIADFKIEAPKALENEEIAEPVIPETESINFDLIKLNIPELLMAFVFKATFLGKKIVLISDQEFLYNHIVNFFKYSMENLFNLDITIITSEDYEKNKNEHDNYLIFKNRDIIKDKDKLINPKKLEFEKGIAQKFLAEYDLVAASIILRNEIKKVYDFSKTIAEFITNSKKKPLTSKLIINHVTKKHDEKIKMSYLRFLINIVKHYFKVEIPEISGI